jgi:hypothetical protein
LESSLQVFIAGIVVGFFSFAYTMVDTARKDRLAYTRSQIGQLYGPLCGLLGVEASVWVAINDEEDREPNLERFMTRVDTSIVPLNGRIEDTAFMSELSITDQEIRRELKTLHFHAESIKQDVTIWKEHDQKYTVSTVLHRKEEMMLPVQVGLRVAGYLTRLHEDEHLYGHEIMGLVPFVYAHELWHWPFALLGSDPYGVESIDCTSAIPRNTRTPPDLKLG